VRHPGVELGLLKSKRGKPFIVSPLNPHESNPNPNKDTGPNLCTFEHGLFEVDRWLRHLHGKAPPPPARPDGPFFLVGPKTRQDVGRRTAQQKAAAALLQSPEAPTWDGLDELLYLAKRKSVKRRSRCACSM